MARRLRLAAVLGTSIIVYACSRATEPELHDVNPPATITDLKLLWAADSSAALIWTAPGDDGTRGKASEYDVRYSPSSLDFVSWSGAARVDSVFAPHVAGTVETLLVKGLGIRSHYSFAVKSADDEGNWSGRSNLVWVTTGDYMDPAPVADLVVINVTEHSVALAWTAPGDDGMVGTAYRYYLRYSRSIITDPNWERASDAGLTQSPRPPGTRETFLAEGLESSTLYYFAIRSLDDSGHLSALSNIVSQTTIRDRVPPDKVFDLAVVRTTPQSATLEWTAPGDDGSVGIVAGYEVRYSEEPISDATWLQASLADSPYPLVPAGSRQQATVHSLAPGVQYSIALKAVDRAGNVSLMSNVVSARTLPPGGIWHVQVDGTGDTRTIQAAIEAASEDDVIMVGPGTYTEDLNFGGKNLVVVSDGGPEVTVLDGRTLEDDPLVRFGPGVSGNTTFSGFTISGAKEAMYIEMASPIVTDNRIVNNTLGIRVYGGKARFSQNTFSGNGTTTSGNWGGAMEVGALQYYDRKTWADVLIENNVFLDNKARFGGAAYIGLAAAMFRGNLIQGNECRYDGGAIFTFSSTGRVVFDSNEFRENVAGDHGGAIAAWQDSWIDIRYNLFIGNIARGEDANGVNGSGGAMHLGGNSGIVQNNTIVFNHGFPDCGAGGIALDYEEPYSYQEWVIERNIIAFNSTSGIGCTRQGTPDRYLVQDNLLFGNTYDLGCGNSVCDSTRVSGNLIADPLFCDPDNGDFHLAEGSPALTYPGGWLGAFPGPGCASALAVNEIRWGRTRSTYGN